MFCDIRVPGGGPYEGDPRWILQRAMKRAEEMGFDAYNIGPELEFFYFRSAKPEGGVPEVLDEGGYFDLTTLDAGSDVRRETVLALEKMGIHVEYTHHEVGPSQHEVDMRYKNALEMADDCMTYRIVVKEYAMKYGWHATFMPKPLFGENGSGMHVHQSLAKDGKNAFYDEDDPYYLSPMAKSFIAGQLKHAREISPLFAQWVNSYKRLVPGYEAPVYLAWSRRNRSALIRVPLYHPGKEGATRAELRCPDPAANPYLCFAGMLQAGLEGIEKGYELPEPMEQNLYHLSQEELAHQGIEQLPATLGEAIEVAADSELVLRTLGEHTFRRFVEIKRQEWDDYRVQVTPVRDRKLPADPLSRRRSAMATLHVLRVFCDEAGECGNPLGVFLDGAEVPAERRQAVAARARLLGDGLRRRSPSAARCRIFTPGLELPFAGHPTRRHRLAAGAGGRRRSRRCGRRPARSRCGARAS